MINVFVGNTVSILSAALVWFVAGTAFNGTLLASDVSRYAPDRGVNFDGEKSYAVVEDGSLFDFDTFSIAAWVKMRNDSGTQMFVNRGDYGGLFSLYYFDPGRANYIPRLRMLVEHLGERLDSRNASYQEPPLNTWMHLVGVYDGRHVHLWVNGEPGDRPRPAEGRMEKRDIPMYIGALQPYEGFFDGELEDIRIYNRAVSAKEVSDIMKGATGGSLDDGLVAHWRSDGVDEENEIWHGVFDGAPTARYYPEGKALIADRTYDGYKGIWYTLGPGQISEYGIKYSGGLGTYTANHVPMAIYAPEVDKTFFVYGGSRGGERYLLAMASYYDHENNHVPRPTIVHDKLGVDDPHDNPSLAIDEDGYIWVFVSGRSVRRDGYIYRSLEPYSVDSFEMYYSGELSTYSQPWWVEGKGFIHMHSQYRGRHRELYFNLSEDGRTWTEPVKLAGMGGHYQVSNQFGERIITSFMMHPDGRVDDRTNLYYVETTDMGSTWRTVDGQALQLPIEDKHGPALIHDYEAEGRLVYINDTQLDANGNPVIFYVASSSHKPGPPGEPRYQKVAHWDGQQWNRHIVSTTTHNYDVGSIYIEGDLWRVFAPAEPGPQRWGTGGEVAIWESRDNGASWEKKRDVTQNSRKNHHYVRRPVNAHRGFYAFWADGNPDVDSDGNPAGDIKSKLYFADYDGNYWELPYEMDDDYARPERK